MNGTHGRTEFGVFLHRLLAPGITVPRLATGGSKRPRQTVLVDQVGSQH